MVFEIADAELAAADEYERTAAYTRIAATLASGKQAWVYVHAGSARLTRPAYGGRVEEGSWHVRR